MPPYIFTIFDDLAELMLASSQFAKTFTEVSLESILPLYEESFRLDYVESVFHWK